MGALKNLNWPLVIGGILVAVGSALTGQIEWPGAAMAIVALFVPAFKAQK
jgi:hypothetical protein